MTIPFLVLYFITLVYFFNIHPVAISQDGKKIVSGGYDDIPIPILDLETCEPIGEPLTVHTGSTESVAISSDGKKIVSGSSDKIIPILDLETGEQIGVLLAWHTGFMEYVAISSDGKKIVSGSYDKTIRIWDLETGEKIGELLTGHTDPVESVAISHNGKKIVSGSDDGTLCIWDIDNKTRFMIEPILSIIQDCHFENAYYDQPEPDDFYRILYTNGANVPKKYEPKPIPVKMRRWKI